MDQKLRASIQTSTFYYFMIILAITTFGQLVTMTVIVFGDISGKEHLVAASVIGGALLGAFGIIRMLTNMKLIVGEMVHRCWRQTMVKKSRQSHSIYSDLSFRVFL